MYSDMSMRVMASSSPKRNSASVRASSVLPTPDGPRKMNEPVGRFGSLSPARERRVPLEAALRPGARAADRLRDGLDRGVLADDALVELLLHAHQLLRLGLGELEDRDARPHRDDVRDLLLADRGALAALAGLPGVLQLALAVGQPALLVAQLRRLLELLLLDRGLLVAPRRLDLLFELPVHGRGGHRLDAHARGGLVDEVDRLVGQEPVGDVAVRQLRRGLERLVGDVDLVVRLVAVAQALEDLHALLERGLVDGDLLEAALQAGVARQVLVAFLQRRRADRLQLAARQGRLEAR